MNAKRAKRLRRQAREMSVGMEYRSYEDVGRNGGIQCALTNCERATYKALKKLASPA